MINQRFTSVGLIFLVHLVLGAMGQEELSNLCPATLPVEGEACTPFPVFESCLYGNFCCPGADDPDTCVPETECYCDSTYKTWQCLEPSITCPSVCPEDRPIGGRVECDIHDRYVCEYEIGPSCPREGYAPDAACTCFSGYFSCYNDCDDDSITPDDNSGDDSVTDDNSGDDSVTDDNSYDNSVTDDNSGDDSVTDDNAGDDSVTDDKSGDDSVTDDNSYDDSVTDDNSDGGEGGDSASSGGVSGTAHVGGEANGNGNNAVSKNDKEAKKERGGKMESNRRGARGGRQKGEGRNLRRVMP